MTTALVLNVLTYQTYRLPTEFVRASKDFMKRMSNARNVHRNAKLVHRILNGAPAAGMGTFRIRRAHVLLENTYLKILINVNVLVYYILSL
jgi:hypothetical protein